MKKTCAICGISIFILYIVQGVHGNCISTSGGVKRYGENCKYRCHCLNNEQCDLNTGNCSSGCAFEWTGPGCQYKNVALGEESRHSDNLQYSDNRYSYLANDRDLTTCSYTAEANYTGKTAAPWYALWFEEEITFSQFVITTDDAHLGYFPNFRVTVQSGITEYEHKARYYKTGTECYHHTSSIPRQKTIHVQCTTPLVGNQLRIQLANTSTQLVLCDFRVYSVCREQFYKDGDTCKTCGFCSNQEVCNNITGVCKDGCAPGYKGTMKCHQECDKGNYGQDCAHMCPNCKSNDCDKVTGACSNGCIPGYQGDKCNSECDKGSYGQDCAHTCPNCKSNDCDKMTGACRNGCIPGYQGDKCNSECDKGSYGQDCKQTCPNCKSNDCDKMTGACRNGCIPGYQDDKCNSVCMNGYYGEHCRYPCTNCLPYQTTCNNVDGKCLHGCIAGWKGDLCNAECESGKWGKNCQNDCGHCANSPCDRSDGTCKTGCKPGYKYTIICDQVCDAGTYGISCGENCSSNCAKPGICNNIDGNCNGCQPGWKGTYCNKKCESGKYGDNCLEECGSCAEHDTCHHINGSCESGCHLGLMQTDLCKTNCPDGTFGLNCSQECGHCSTISTCHKESGVCETGCLEGFIGSLCVEEAPVPMQIAGIAGGSSAAVVVVVLIVVIVIVVRRRRRKPRNEKRYSTAKESLPEQAFEVAIDTKNDTKKAVKQDNIYQNTSDIEQAPATLKVSRTYPDVTNPDNGILVNDLLEYVKAGFQDDDYFVKQFDTLPYGPQYPTTAATKSGNVSKNKYKAMYAYDHSRVVLKTGTRQSDSDYINASYIKGQSGEVSYIAAQGPIVTSVDDFWQLLWQQNSTTVVMLTNVTEEGKVKCVHYFPEVNECLRYGQICVKLELEDVFSEFTIRKMSMYHEGADNCRKEVTHFHYTAWPDKSVPRCPSSLLQFWRRVRKYNPRKRTPWVVHCSAGVGRTGTFLALDILYDQGKNDGAINIYQCTSKLREQRVNMVQTKDQYKFIHSIMIEALVLPSEPVSVDSFPDTYARLKAVDRKSEKTMLSLQYESFQDDTNETTEYSTQPSLNYATAKSHENKTKNRYDNILAPNDYRPFLFTPVHGTTDYINAIYIPGYRQKHGYILSQTPLKTAEVDNCRLIFEEEIEIIVCFEDQGKEEVGKYLPKSGSLTVGPFTTECLSEDVQSTYIKRTHEMTFKEKKLVVTQLIFQPWQKTKLVPSSVDKMLSFIQEIERLQRVNRNNPVLIQCLNGAERSGLVVVLMNILERARFDGEVSISQVIRLLKCWRQQIIPNYEQFQFCHEVLLAHELCDSTYANM